MKMVLNMKDMNMVCGGDANGVHGHHHFLIEGRQQEIFEEMKLKMEQTADIRMRASEAALKAAMRLEHQEIEIKEAVRRNRELLGQN